MTDRPSDLLNAAADRLDALLAEVTPGPWESLDHGDRLIGNVDGGYFDYVVDEPISHSGNAAYIATMDPVVGRALVALLRQKVCAPPRQQRDLLDLARAILGGES